MQKLVLFTIGFAMSCGFCTDALWDRNLSALILLSLLAGVLCLFVGKRKKWARGLFGIAFGLCLGFGWFAWFRFSYLMPIAPLDGTTIPLTVTAGDYSRQGQYSDYVEGRAVLEGKTYRIRIYLKDEPQIAPGDELRGDFRIRITAPSGEKESAYYQGTGMFLTASQIGDLEIHTPEKQSMRYLPARVRRMIQDNLTSFFPEDTVAFAKAIFLGDTEDLGYELDTALKVSGIRHVVAVSGLHVSLIFGLLYYLFRFSPKLTALVSIPTLLFFAALTGFTPSVLRACIMTIFMIIGWVFLEEYDSLTGLAAASIFLLIVNPFTIKSVSFQLSVASVAGIILYQSPLQAWIMECKPAWISGKRADKLWRGAAASVSVSASAMFLTVPISCYTFGMVSIVGILTNLLTLWCVGFLFSGAAIVGILGGMLPWVGWIAAGITSWLIRYVQFMARLLASFPFASLYTQNVFALYWIALCYFMLFLFFMLGKRWGKVCITFAAAALIPAIVLSIVVPRLDDVRLSVLNVGEGQCILLQSQGMNYLIDCGGDSDTQTANLAAETLLSQGIRSLDGIILTHFDRDHTGALEYLMSRIRVKQCYLPDFQGSSFLDEFLSKHPNQAVLIDENTSFPMGCGMITISAPGSQKADNENCLCVLFASEKCVILITGDRGIAGEKYLMEQLSLPDVDVLIAGHHGSRSSTSKALLQTITPEIVIISCGANNRYGHPTQEVLDRLADVGCSVYRTDIQGTVLVRR